ncbi:pyridoxamine 5'-phosphate oxidase family protein [Amycolatopsis umgeniensis]|uniref:PPOX class probable F420-dependent enzyme n=1 Tax=Amycolatopsis umgeniensis TaxID=336628 RepID=A0A841B5I0_9PSEU|nr:PPOX class probable F420-dependent enzyme [Amycolatopsis umgeniensis]
MKRDQSLIERLARERNAWLCTLRPDGSPHVTPVWFVYLDDVFWIGSGARNVKVRNVGNDPRVSLALEDGDAPVVAEGLARVHRGTLPEGVLDALAAKYDGWAAGEEIEPFGARVLIEVPVKRWLLQGVAQ